MKHRPDTRMPWPAPLLSQESTLSPRATNPARRGVHLTRPTRRLTLMMSVAVVVASSISAAPQAAASESGENIRVVLSEALPNLPGNSLTAVVVEYAPGGRSASHRHAGTVFAYVLSGAIRSQLDDGPVKVYEAGEAFFEPPGTHHRISENASSTEPASLLAVIVAEDGATLTVFDE